MSSFVSILPLVGEYHQLEDASKILEVIHWHKVRNQRLYVLPMGHHCYAQLPLYLGNKMLIFIGNTHAFEEGMETYGNTMITKCPRCGDEDMDYSW